MTALKVIGALITALLFYAIPVFLGNLFISGIAWEVIKLAWIVVVIFFGVGVYRYFQRPATGATGDEGEAVQW